MKAIVLLALFGLAFAANYEQMFQNWLSEQQKNYVGAEYTKRLQIFTNNAKFIEAENKKGNSYELGFTRFADLTNQEFRSMWLMTPRNYTVQPAMPSTVSTNVDWRNKGAVTAIKDQGQCGSCWSFSTTGGIEGCKQLATGDLVSLSEQQLVDCAGLEYGNMGCNGGTQDGAMKYIIATKYIDTEASYGYKAAKGTCSASSANSGASITGYTDITSGSETALQSSIIARPTPVSIDASGEAFQLYNSGVYCPKSCSTSSLDHAVLAVGMQVATSSTSAYYIVKNSWGTSWGISGYINMCADQSNHCGIATASSYPTGCK